tara:strand:- start:384 stop:1841 length:1458 start_codon:yes stop_codon:yes gene_type:complete
MKKLINNFEILSDDLQSLQSFRNFSINGDVGAVFDLEITNAAGSYYNFNTESFTNKTVATTAASVGSTEDSFEIVILNANANIKVGMTLTGSGIDSETKVTALRYSPGQSSPSVIVMDKSHSIANGQTIKAAFESGLNSYVMNSSYYNNKIVFPTITSDDTYTVLLTAVHHLDTELKSQENEIDLNPLNTTFGDFLTDGFRNSLFKSIEIKQYVNTVATINMISAALTTLSVDFSSNTFNISKPRGFLSNDVEAAKTSFSWTVTTPDSSAITKSQNPIASYFETLKTQTVNGAVSNGRVVVLDSVENIVIGMKISGVSSGSLISNSYVLSIDVDNKTIIISKNNTFADNITLTFQALGAKGASAYGSEVSIENLTMTLTPLTVTVVSGGSTDATPELNSAVGIKGTSTTKVTGIGVPDNTTISARSSDVITLSSGNTVLEGGTILTVNGSSSSAVITGDIIIKKMGSTNFTSSLNLDSFLSFGIS